MKSLLSPIRGCSNTPQHISKSIPCQLGTLMALTISTTLINSNVANSLTIEYDFPIGQTKDFGNSDRELTFAPVSGRATVQREAFFESGVIQN